MFNPEYELRLRVAQQTDRGQVRKNNEDSVLVQGNEKSLVAIVADGMGGAVAGEEASRIAVETIQTELLTEFYPHPDDYHATDVEELAEILQECVVEASHNIHQRAVERPELKGMGTTLTMAFVRQSGVVLAHVGDSRAYLVDEDGMTRITRDHSFVQALVDAGHITEDEAADHPMKNVLYRALGQSSEDVEVDVIDDVHLYANNRLMLCSDGLTLHLADDEIEDIMLASNDPDTICQTLVQTANTRGGKDNISVIVIVAEAHTVSNNAHDDSGTGMDYEYEDDDPTLPVQQPVIPPSEAPTRIPPPNNSSYGEGNDIYKPMQ